MQSNYSDYPTIEVTNRLVDGMPPFANPDNLIAETDGMQPVRFHGQFEDCMEMYADVGTVAEYLNAHPEWFRRCAHPMMAQPLGNNGYALTIGPFGSFGYEVEPKIGLELLPPDRGVYRILTIPVPDYVAPGYDVDFNAAMQLTEATIDASVGCPGDVTRVEWQLDLVVAIQFPRFIYRLPMSLIQSTGTSLLRQIVRQVSHRLTHKVQQDFHSSLGLPMPRKKGNR
ncbi:DUF1997 domain-containing protein [Microseira sp. BLCC-F43]|jgi:hypothetical protein|uniref:DUF1997 domain-containing protein n=1 Tax=Microseira sp. BLCC-F43 TaxID=3153602 RepID=UPI0035B86D53